MDRIKRFYRKHEETIDSSLMIACGISTTVCAAIALYKINEVEGMRIKGVDYFVRHDGDELIEVYLVNGITHRFHKLNP